MGIKDNTPTAAQTLHEQRVEQPEANYQQPERSAPRQQRTSAGGSFRGLSGLSGGFSGISRTTAAESLTRARDAMKKSADKLPDPSSTVKIDILGLDTDAYPELDFSLAVMAVHDPAQKDMAIVSYYIMQLSNTGTQIEGQQVNINGRTLFHTPLASSSLNDVAKKTVEDLIARSYHGKQPLLAGSGSLGATVDFDDTDAVDDVVQNAAIACSDAVANMMGTDWTIGQEVDPRSKSMELVLSTRLTRNDRTELNVFGEPVRSDMKVMASSRFVDQGGNVRSKQVIELDGYMDLSYSPMPYPNVGGGHRRPSARDEGWTYRAGFVITKNVFHQLSTVRMQLLALTSIAALYENDAAMGCLFPDPSPKIPGFRELGSLNVEGGFQGNNDYLTDIAGSSDDVIADYLADLIQPNFDVFIDVAEAGPDTWRNEVFLDAARGLPEANDAIFAELNAMTDGHFGDVMGNQRIDPFYVALKFEGGYWVHDGEKLDKREMDYIAVATAHAENDIQTLEDYSNAMNDMNADDIERIHEINRVAQNLMPGAKSTSYIYRLGVDPEFLVLMMEACKRAGLSYTTGNLYRAGTRQRARMAVRENVTNRNFSGLGLVSGREVRGRDSRSSGRRSYSGRIYR